MGPLPIFLSSEERGLTICLRTTCSREMPAIHRTNLSTLKVLEQVNESTAHTTCLLKLYVSLLFEYHRGQWITVQKLRLFGTLSLNPSRVASILPLPLVDKGSPCRGLLKLNPKILLALHGHFMALPETVGGLAPFSLITDLHAYTHTALSLLLSHTITHWNTRGFKVIFCMTMARPCSYFSRK